MTERVGLSPWRTDGVVRDADGDRPSKERKQFCPVFRPLFVSCFGPSKPKGEVMKSMLAPLAASVVILVAIAGCGSSIHNSTPEEAAKSFFQAICKSDSKAIDALNKSHDSTNEILREASGCGFSGVEKSEVEMSTESDSVFRFHRKKNVYVDVAVMPVDGKYYVSRLSWCCAP
jgi:hypothetical protein